jgi:hypothetical protein
MRLVFVHGIHEEDKAPAALQGERAVVGLEDSWAG